MTDAQEKRGWIPRRRWLAISGGILAGPLAGCLGDDADSGDDGGSDDTDDDNASSDDTDDDSDDSNSNDGDNGEDSGSTNGEDSDGTNGEDSDGTGGDEGEEDPPEPEATVVLESLRVGDQSDAASLDFGEDAAIAVTVHNGVDRPDVATVSLSVTPVDGDEPLYSDSQSVPLDAAGTDEAVFGGVTAGLAAGSYDVVANTEDDEVSTTLDVFGTVEVTIEVYTQRVAEEYRAESGTVAISDGNEQVASEPITDGQVSAELALAETTSYTVEVTDLDDGAWPPTTESVTVDSPSETVQLVAGYEIPDIQSFRFTGYLLDETRYPNTFGEFIWYGSYPGVRAGYHIYYILQGTSSPTMDLDDSPPEYGADLEALSDDIGAAPPSHQLKDGGSRYYFVGGQNEWVPATFNNPFGRFRQSHNVGSGLDYTEARDWDREWVGTEEVRDATVDVYDIPDIDATAYVDPETGYTLRYVQRSFENGPNSYEVAEFYDHNEPDGFNWELIKNRSSDKTGENIDGEELRTLPWE